MFYLKCVLLLTNERLEALILVKHEKRGKYLLILHEITYDNYYIVTRTY